MRLLHLLEHSILNDPFRSLLVECSRRVNVHFQSNFRGITCTPADGRAVKEEIMSLKRFALIVSLIVVLSGGVFVVTIASVVVHAFRNADRAPVGEVVEQNVDRDVYTVTDDGAYWIERIQMYRQIVARSDGVIFAVLTDKDYPGGTELRLVEVNWTINSNFARCFILVGVPVDE